jgi:hypothetical protein
MALHRFGIRSWHLRRAMQMNRVSHYCLYGQKQSLHAAWSCFSMREVTIMTRVKPIEIGTRERLLIYHMYQTFYRIVLMS